MRKIVQQTLNVCTPRVVEPNPKVASRRKQSNPIKTPDPSTIVNLKNLTDKAQKKMKHDEGTLNEIRHLQSTVKLVLPKAPFLRLVREVTQGVRKNVDFRYQIESVMALQEAAEAFLVSMFEQANLAARHAHRITIKPADIQLIMRILRLPTPTNEFAHYID